jgi:predicted P-loop ATPase
VIVGTTNEDHFLFDPTGDRRFWVIDVGHNRIDTERLREIRDQVWAEAVTAHLAGEPIYLGPDLDAARAEANTAYRVEEPWFALISQWVEAKGDKGADVGIEECLRECVQKEAKDWKRSDYQVIGSILRNLGFHRYRVHVGGRRFYRFRKVGAREWGGPAPEVSNVITFPGFG